MHIPLFTQDGYGSTNSLCPPSEKTYTGKALTTGWGRYLPNVTDISDKLKIAEMLLMPIEDCIAAYGELDRNKQLCLKGKLGAKVCSGDSGGPLFQYVDGYAEAIGISSFGAPNCPDSLSVFTSVAAYHDWIDQYS
ncbi:ovochymase-1-like protein [Dinothrombium tinctorium]|uniref:Ovochymase-1-like protein n=1 Tax=Dinothrombium tinctorium TaxID=1965070 RepID=A0A443R564_9ACAR|nr:ovochymase-1-like protein [Dinothrombium tinctorium]